MKRVLVPLLLAGLLCPATLSAQRFGVAPRIGTTGVGADVALSIHPNVNVRGGVGFVPIEPEQTFSDIDFAVSFPSPQFVGMLDFYPSAESGFRVSAGALVKSDDIEVDAEFAGTVNVGGRDYTGSEVGSLTGVVETSNAAPYVGLGWGNHATTGVGFSVDLGVGFHGDPTVDLTSVGGAVSDDPQFREDLEREAQEVEDDLGTYYKIYPVISVGITVGLGQR